MTINYSRNELVAAYKSLEIAKGDTLFVTTGLGFLGRMLEAENLEQLCNIHLEVLLDAIGHCGTIIVPTYSYTFGSSSPSSLAIYDPACTPAQIGPFPNYIINKPGFKRSLDPMVSVGVKGKMQSYLIDNLPHNSYGYGSIFDRLLGVNAKCISIGLGTNWTPFIHYLDYIMDAPYRYDKLFAGYIKDDKETKFLSWNYTVPARLKAGSGNCHKIGQLAAQSHIWRSYKLGKASIWSCNYSEYFEFCKRMWQTHLWVTTANTFASVREQEIDRICNFNIPPVANMFNDINSFKKKKKLNSIVGYSLSDAHAFLRAHLTDASIDYFRVPTGTNLGGYIVPEAKIITKLVIDNFVDPVLDLMRLNQFSQIVEPHSSTWTGTLNCHDMSHSSSLPYVISSIPHLDKLLSPEHLVYVSASLPVFSLSAGGCDYLRSKYKSKELLISYEAQPYYSEIEAIVLKPSGMSSFKEPIIYDSVTRNISTCTDIKKIQKALSQGIPVVIAPSRLAKLLYTANQYPLDRLACLYELSSKAFSDLPNLLSKNATKIAKIYIDTLSYTTV